MKAVIPTRGECLEEHCFQDRTRVSCDICPVTSNSPARIWLCCPVPKELRRHIRLTNIKSLVIFFTPPRFLCPCKYVASYFSGSSLPDSYFTHSHSFCTAFWIHQNCKAAHLQSGLVRLNSLGPCKTRVELAGREISKDEIGGFRPQFGGGPLASTCWTLWPYWFYGHWRKALHAPILQMKTAEENCCRA